MYLSHHSLRTNRREQTLDFYCNKLGMRLLQSITRHEINTAFGHDFLAFSHTHQAHITQLEIISSPTFTSAQKNDNTGYWKIGITLPDIDIAVDRLTDTGVIVSTPQQFRDIGYLCHLEDPSGNSIELLQHWFDQNKPAMPPNDLHILGSQPTLGQITLRIKDPAKSLSFYRDVLGMRLLSRQVVEPYQFTLYFLAFCEDDPPVPDIDAVENREWLWQLSYTTLELQHRWGTETDPSFTYDTAPENGFECLTIADINLVELEKKIINASITPSPTLKSDELFNTSALHVTDPDGYAIRFLGDIDNR